MNGGYINEASEAEARTRESNRELPPTPRRHDNLRDLDVDFRRCNNIKNGWVFETGLREYQINDRQELVQDLLKSHYLLLEVNARFGLLIRWF